jgi:hypothetical protein
MKGKTAVFIGGSLDKTARTLPTDDFDSLPFEFTTIVSPARASSLGGAILVEMDTERYLLETLMSKNGKAYFVYVHQSLASHQALEKLLDSYVEDQNLRIEIRDNGTGSIQQEGKDCCHYR